MAHTIAGGSQARSACAGVGGTHNALGAPLTGWLPRKSPRHRPIHRVPDVRRPCAPRTQCMTRRGRPRCCPHRDAMHRVLSGSPQARCRAYGARRAEDAVPETRWGGATAEHPTATAGWSYLALTGRRVAGAGHPSLQGRPHALRLRTRRSMRTRHGVVPDEPVATSWADAVTLHHASPTTDAGRVRMRTRPGLLRRCPSGNPAEAER